LHLRTLLGSHESSDLVGSYERPRYPEAQFKIAELYRDGLHDHAAARREFQRLYEEHPKSTLRDDALWSQARLAATEGDRSAACRIVAKLVRELPESRYAPCGRVLCDSAPPVPKNSRGCADYIVRSVGGRDE